MLSATMGISTTTAVLTTLATSFFVSTSAPLVRTAFVAVMAMLEEPFPQNFPNAVVVQERSGSSAQFARPTGSHNQATV